MNDSGLMNAGADLRHLFEIDALNGEVVLFFFFLGDGDSFGSIDALVDLESQEVLDQKGLG